MLLITTALNIVSNIVLDFSLIDKWGLAGLSLATTISFYVSLIVKFYFIRDMFVFNSALRKKFCRIAVSCIMASIVPIIGKFFLDLSAYLELILGSGIFLLAYCFCVFKLDKEYKEMLWIIIFKSK